MGQLVEWLRKTGTAHTLKELEKTVPAAIQGIHGMAVKEYLNALLADDKLTVDKIGTGNWYWSFAPGKAAAQAIAAKKRAKLKAGTGEVETLQSGIASMTSRVEQVQAGKGAEVDKLKALAASLQLRADNETTTDDNFYRTLVETHRNSLQKQQATLQTELEQYADCDPEQQAQRKKEQERRVDDIRQVTDSIWTLESYMAKLCNGDRNQLDMLRRECYGKEYREGEELEEW